MRKPPGPEAPSPVQVVRWLRTPFDFMEDCAARYGEIFTMMIPGLGDVHVVSQPEAIKQLFALAPDQAHAGKANWVLKPFLGEKSLLLLDGQEHMRTRRMMLPAFHGERMGAYGTTMLTLADEAIDALPLGTAFSAHDVMQKITLGVIVRTVFGVTDASRFAELTELLTRGLDTIAWPPMLFPMMQRDLGPLSPWGKFLRISARVSAIFQAEIDAARRVGTTGRSDVLAMLLAARDESGAPLTDEELQHELVTLLVAGHETTATSLAWALRWLLVDPELVERVRAEVVNGATDASGELVPARVAKLELLDGCVREALRLQPVIPLVGRVMQEPLELMGYTFPVGARIAPSIYLVHRKPSLYPEPARFLPERYRTFKPSASEWIPFGGGFRRCIGAAFAIYEMKMVLAQLLRRVDLVLKPGPPVRTVRRAITLTPSDGLQVIARARRAA